MYDLWASVSFLYWEELDAGWGVMSVGVHCLSLVILLMVDMFTPVRTRACSGL